MASGRSQEGQIATEEGIEPLRAEFAADRKKASKKAKKRSSGKSDVDTELDQVEAEAEDKWKDELLDTLLGMSPLAFERLAQRLLRESGFSSVVVTGRAGDGGIDGLGVYQLSLLSSRCSFNASVTGQRRPWRSATSEVRWRAAETKGCHNDRDLHRGRAGGVKARWRSTDRSHRRRPAMRVAQAKAIGVTTTPRIVEDVKVEVDYFASLDPKK